MLDFFLVGGAVRGLLCGEGVHDLDFTFIGEPSRLVQMFPRARKTGSARPVWLADGCEFTKMEGTPDGDAVCRDFAVNAVVMDAGGRLAMHGRFLGDLAGRILRAAAPDSFTRDPLRVYRAARFAAELPSFAVDQTTLEMMGSLASEHPELLARLPRERVSAEMLKAFSSARPSRFFQVLHAAGCLRPWFDELAPAAEIPAGPTPWHDNSVLEHTLEVMDRCAGHPVAVWMGLCHDLGKIRTDASMLPHHYGHEKKGVELARSLGNRLGLSNFYIRAGIVGTVLHMKGGMYGTLRAGTKRDLLSKLHDAGIGHDFWVLAGADGGWNWESVADRDFRAMQAVHLPEEWRNRGAESGERLRSLQCEALGRLPRMEPEKAGA